MGISFNFAVPGSGTILGFTGFSKNKYRVDKEKYLLDLVLPSDNFSFACHVAGNFVRSRRTL